MIRRLMIPVAGTIAALVVVLWAHEPRGAAPEPPPFELPEPEDTEPAGEEAPQPRTLRIEIEADGTLRDLDDGDEFSSPADLAERRGDARHALIVSAGKDVTDEALDGVMAELRQGDRFEVRKKAAREPETFEIELQADGALLDLDRRFASVEEFVQQLGEVRHTLVLSNGEGVTEAALDEVLAKLRDRFQVRKVYRAPEAPPAEGR